MMKLKDTPDSLEMKEFERELFGPEDKPNVEFYTHMRLYAEESKQAGRRIEYAYPYIRISFKDQKDMHSRVATEKDINKYPAQYAAYEEQICRGNQDRYTRWPGMARNSGGQSDSVLPEGKKVSPIVHASRSAQG